MNRNIFSLVFSKARNMLVVAPEIATGAHKSSRGSRPSRARPHAFALQFVFAVGALAGMIDCAHAQSTVTMSNGSFETGDLTGWTAGGGTGSQSSTAYSSSGVGVSVVTGMESFSSQDGSQPGSHSWTVNPYGNYMASLQATDTEDSTNDFAAAMAALGLSSDSSTQIANALGGSVTNAAWITQTLNLQAGDTFTMAWEYVSTDYDPYNDGSITSLVNTSNPSNLATVNNQTAQYALLGETVADTGAYSTGDYGATGWEISTYTVTETGTYTLGFASFNLSDTVNSPVLFVDQQPGTTFDNGVPFYAIAPNPGSGAPTTPTTSNIDATDNAAGLAASPATLLPVFDGGTLVLDGTDLTPYDFTITGNGGTVDLAGQSATIANPIADDTAGTPGSLTVTNSGSGGALTLTGVNTYTGATSIDSGATLSLTGAGSIASSSSLTDNGVFDIQGASGDESIAALAGNGSVQLGANGLTITDGNGSNFAGTIAGSGSLTLENGTQALSGTNTYAGGTYLDGGTLQVSSDANLGDTGGALNFNGGTLENTASFTTTRDIALTGDATFDTDNGTTLTDTAGAITGSGDIDKLGGGTLVLGAADNTGGVNVDAGTLQIAGQSTYTGATTIADGATLALTGNGSIADSSGVADNGTFDISGASQDSSIASLSGGSTGVVELGGHDLTLTAASGSFAGTLQGNGGLTVSGGTETLSGANTYLGTTTIDTGATLKLDGGGELSQSALSAGVLANGTFDIGGANGNVGVSTLSGNGAVDLGSNDLVLNNADGTFAGTISGSGGVEIAYGTETLSGDNTYAGGTDIQGGKLIVSADENLGDASGALHFGNSQLDTTASFTSTRDISISDAANFIVEAGTTLTDTAGAITGTGQINKLGTGTLVLGANDATGGVYVSAGTLQLTGAGSGTGEVDVGAGATLALTGDGSIANASALVDNGNFDISGANGTQSITTLIGNSTGTVTLGNNDLTLTNANGEYDGTIGGNGGVTLENGVEEFTGSNTYAGGTTLNGGTLLVSSDANLGDASGALDFNGGTLENTASFTSTRDIHTTGQANFYTDAGTTLTDTAGAITGSGPIVKLGTGTLVLGADDATGGVQVGAGTLQLTGAGTDSGVVNVASGATLALTGNGSIASASALVGNGNFDISGANGPQSITTLIGSSTGTVTLGNNDLTLTNANGEYDGTIGGSGGITLAGGVEEFTGSNTYAGGTTLGGGTLLVSSDANLGAAGGALNFGGGTLENTASFTTTRDIHADGGANFYTDAGTTLTDIAGSITGTGPINKLGAGMLVLGADQSTGGLNVGAGTLLLTGTATDTGATTIAAGATLAIVGSGSDASASSIDNDGTFDISGASHAQSITSLTGNGAVALGSNQLTLTDASGIYGGTIGGSGGITLAGGTEQLTGSNTYTGGTTLAGGTLKVSSDANLGDAGGALNFNGGTLENTASFTTTRDIHADGGANFYTDAGTTLTDTAGTITGNGPITKLGTGTLVLGADHSTGGLNVGAGTVQLTGASTDTGATTIATGATLAITGNGSDASASSIDNSGTFDISGANGPQSIASLAGTGTVALGGNGLTLTQANGNFAGTIGGHGGVTVSGGTEVLSGTNTYTGGTTLTGGNLVVSSDANLGAAGTPVNFDGGTLTVTQSMNTSRDLVIGSGGAGFNTLAGVTVTDSGNISGSGGLVKTGDGTLIVSGTNTFTGGTLIDGGVVKIDTGSSLGTGTILLNGGTLQTTATLNNNQNVVVSGNAGVHVDAGTTTLLAGDIQEASGAGCFVKSGAGTLDFSGSQTLTGGTCVQEGMLRANGNLVSNVSVYAQGELRGVGIIEGAIDVSGRLAPGHSPGTLVATGTVTMHAGSTYEEDIDGLGTGTGAGNYSRLIITGANSQFVADGTLVPLLRGITGDASNTYTPQIGDIYQIVVAQGGIVGQFSALTQPEGLAANTRMVVFYNVDDNHSIELGVVPDSYADLIAKSGANRNALSVAGAMDSAINLQAGGTASDTQSTLLLTLAGAKADQLGSVLTALSGELYADQAAAGRASGLAMQSDVMGHLNTDDSHVTGEQKGHLAWANVSHTGNRWSGDAQGSGFQTGTNQTTAGVDLYAADGTVVGVAASNHETRVNNGLSQGTIRGNDGILYAQQAVASVLVDGMVASGHDTWLTRRTDPTGVAGSLGSRVGGNNTMANLAVRMPMQLGGTRIEPYASVTWQRFDRDATSEGSNSPAALQVSRLSVNGTRAMLGIDLSSQEQNPLTAEVTYRLGAAIGMDSRSLLSPIVQASLAGESFQTQAPDIGRGFVQLQANGTLRLSHATYLYGGLTDELGARRASYGVTAGVRVSF